MSTNHIEARGRTMYCTRCECAATVKMPANIDNIIKQMDDFRDTHEKCPPRASEAEMSEYIRGFDAGCEHLMREIELFNNRAPLQPALVPEVLKHLRKGLK